MNGITNNATAASNTSRKTTRESIIEQMLRQQSENKQAKELAYSSIFSKRQTSADSTKRASSNISTTDSPANCSNTAPLVTRRRRPEWAEPTVSVDQVAILKSSLERKGEDSTTNAETMSYNVNTRRASNADDSKPACHSSTKSSNNNYNDHFQKVDTATSKSSSTASSVVEQNLNAKMSFLNQTPLNGTMAGTNGDVSRTATTRHTASTATVNNEASILKTSTKTTSASEESSNISTTSASISPNNNGGMVNENSPAATKQQNNMSVKSGESRAEPCV